MAGGLLTLIGAAALVSLGLYFDATGGGPSDILTYVVWLSFFLGLALVGVGLVRLAREL